MNFVTIDFETAKQSRESACAVGLVNEHWQIAQNCRGGDGGIGVILPKQSGLGLPTSQFSSNGKNKLGLTKNKNCCTIQSEE